MTLFRSQQKSVGPQGDCNIGCDQPMVNASGPRGSSAAAFDCLARAARDVEAHGLKLAFVSTAALLSGCIGLTEPPGQHPTDVNGIQNDQGKIVMLSRSICVLSVSLIQKVSLFQPCR